MQSSMLGEIDKILSRGDDVMIKRKRENGKPVDVVFAIRLNVAAKCGLKKVTNLTNRGVDTRKTIGII